MITRLQSCVLGIDLGTSGARVIAIDANHAVLASAATAYTNNDYRQPNYWWQAVRVCLTRVLEEVRPEAVRAIAVDGTSGSVLPINASGEPLATPMMYNDPVTDDALVNAVMESMPATSAAGGSTSGLAKALSFLSLSPAIVLHQADWIVGKLTSNYRLSDANNALKTGFDPVAMAWPDWIDQLGAVRDVLPEVWVPGSPMQPIAKSTARQFQLSPDVQVVAGTTDGCASFLATGCNGVGEAVSALGSTLTVKLLSDAPVFAPEFGVYSHRIGDQWLVGGASNTGGAVLSHFFSNEELDALSANMAVDTPTGLSYYPLLKPGERFPINDAKFPPKLTPRPDDDQQFLQALLEGIASVEKLAYDKLQSSGAPSLASIRSVGGASSNAAFTSIRQRTLSVPFLDADSVEAAYGTATLAAKGATELSLW